MTHPRYDLGDEPLDGGGTEMDEVSPVEESPAFGHYVEVHGRPVFVPDEMYACDECQMVGEHDPGCSTGEDEYYAAFGDHLVDETVEPEGL